MKYVEVVANAGSSDTIQALADKANAQDCRFSLVSEDGMQSMRLLINDDKLQWVLDALQNVLGGDLSAEAGGG